MRDAASSSAQLGTPSLEEIAYEPPTITVLGTLAELTLGGDTAGPSDGFGFAGDQGSV